MSVLFYTSSLPGSEIHLPPFPYSDKVVHFLAYAVLGALIAWRKRIRARMTGVQIAAAGIPDPISEPETASHPSRWDLRGLTIGTLYGIGDEFHQRFVPMRMYGYGDMTADFLGVWFGIWIYRKLGKRAVAD